MSSDDDPEARIRELERTLSDQSSELTQSASEAGSRQYGTGYVNAPPPPPTSPYTVPRARSSYGGPLPPLRAPSPRGAGRGWLVFAVMGAVTVAFVAGIAIFISNVFSGVNSVIDTFGRPSTASGGGGPFGAPASGGNHASAPTVATAEPIAPPGGGISVAGVGEDKAIACNDSVVNVSGVSNTVVLTGQCRSVTVSGVKNIVTVGAVATISASGFDNRVTFLSGSPDIQNPDDSNVVERG